MKCGGRSWQRKVYTKASRVVKSVSRTEKTIKGIEWAGERHKGRLQRQGEAMHAGLSKDNDTEFGKHIHSLHIC